MAIESATYISDLVSTNPLGGDSRKTSDDHHRLIKAVLKSTFPNASAAINPSVAEFNYLVGVTSLVQTQIDAKLASSAKAADSELLDGLDSLAYIKADGSVNLTGDLNTTGQIKGITPVAISDLTRKDYVDGEIAGISGTAAFTSGEESITSGGLLTLPHSLGARPLIIQTELICKTAEDNWAIGDIIIPAQISASGVNRVNTIYSDSTNIYLLFEDSAACFATTNKTTSAVVTLTNANWKVIISAMVEQV